MAAAIAMTVTEKTVDLGKEARRSERDSSYRREILSLIREIKFNSACGIEYFRHKQSETNGKRFFEAFCRLHEHTNPGIEPSVEYLLNVAHLYDFDPSVPGNGYRSMITVIQKCSIRILVLIRYITCNRDSFIFRGGHYSRELESYVTAFGQLRACVYYLEKLVAYCPDGVLFPDEDSVSAEDQTIAEQLMGEVESLCQESFYGRCLGFQFCESMVRPLTTVNLVMASFSDGYPHSSKVLRFASSVVGSHKYILDPDLRAQRVIEITRNGDIEFCKAFWSLAENQLMHTVPLFVCPSVAVDKVIIIPPDTFEMPLAKGSDTVTIYPPCAHSGPGAVITRLICYRHRAGQEQEDSKKCQSSVLPMSDGLIIHCHGGGFVAQSSASHQVYLRQWAKDLDIPLLCVDYSLAPEHPFPRQLEEVFYAYCWAIKHSHFLGSTAKRVCIVGDSAGGNLAVATALKAVAYGVRLPDAVFSIYGSLLIKYSPSPSRILSLMDPLLPLGILPRCLGAYVCGLRQLKAYAGNKSSNANVFKFPSVTKPTSESENGAISSSGLHDQEKHFSVNGVIPPSTKSSDRLIEDGDVTGETDRSVAVDESLSTSPDAFHYMHDGYKTHRNVDSIDSGFLEPPGSANKDNWNPVKPDERLCVSSYVTPLEMQADEAGPSLLHFPGDTEPGPSSSSASGTASTATGTLSLQESCGVVNGQPLKKPRKSELHLNLDAVRRRKASSSLGKSASSPSFVTPVETPSSILSFVSAGSTPQTCFADSGPFCTPTYAKMRHFAQSPVRQFKPLAVDRNPFMSPLYASDDYLRSLCPVYLLTCHLDPMLDDSVMFAKRLRSVGTKVQLDLVDGLPHGFLNFVLISSDAKKGSELCISRLKEIFCIESVV